MELRSVDTGMGVERTVAMLRAATASTGSRSSRTFSREIRRTCRDNGEPTSQQLRSTAHHRRPHQKRHPHLGDDLAWLRPTSTGVTFSGASSGFGPTSG
ncbi:MAG: hypothetical protein M0C28_15755 [Candidatus Moduliflexus flocculans]|nr:hypothetical protein [Candidatus Moduliflexus flocculans]